MRMLPVACSCMFLLGCVEEPGHVGASGKETPLPGESVAKESASRPLSPLDYRMTGIGGEELDLGTFRGKVVLFVNVASRCGFTNQYAGLQRLHERFKDKGFAVIGVPANDFLAQEPGTDEEIAAFCEERFGVTFPMLSKVSVVGENQAAPYRVLTAWSEDPGPVKWNFEKFLVGRNGQVVARFRSKVAPEDPELVAAVERALE